MIVGMKWDKSFGPVVTAGIGGIYVEILKDVTFRVCPISSWDAEEMIKELKGYEILKGARGGKAIDFKSLFEVLIKVCKLSIANKIREMDINPLFCSDKGCLAVDIRVMK